MFKKGDKVENIHTHKRREIIALEKVTVEQNPFTQVTVYVLDDREGIIGRERWVEDQLVAHWSKI